MKSEIDVVLPFCHRDQPLAVLLLHWLRGFNRATIRTECVLAPSGTCSQRMIYQAYVAAQEVFDSVSVRVCDIQDAPWPVGPNRMFAWIAQSQRRPFLWLEPDCIPKREQWFEELREAYANAKKPIIADHYDETHTSGIAVYAPADARVLANVGNPAAAWDSREPELFRALSENTPLIQHFWGQKNLAPRFTPKGDGKPGEATLRLLEPASCLFHRCKDGSLMTLLRPKFDIGILSPPAERPTRSSDTCFVQLGRYGDIINMLPVWRHIHVTTGLKPSVVVSDQFSDVFDGVRYVQPIPIACGPYDLKEGIRIARQRFKNTVVTQVYGTGMDTVATVPHFNQESWKRAGYFSRFEDSTLRLVFDRRDYRSERTLVEKCIVGARKPVVLVNLKGGVSSRFQGHAEFSKEVLDPFEDRVQFVDISDILCHRIYDLSGILELADGLVTTDTATLHLAGVSDIPVIALLSDRGSWLQSAPRCSVAWSAPSNQWQHHQSILEQKLEMIAYRMSRVFHVFERHGQLSDREMVAQETWHRTGWTLRPYEKYVRDARSIRDARNLPFLKDILDHGMAGLEPWDILVFTNSDIALRDGIDGELRSKMRSVSLCTSRRMDHDGGGNRMPYAGRDLVAFRVGWLRRNFHAIPDFLIGASHWDLWAMIQSRIMVGNGKTDWKDLEVDSPECELPLGLCDHQRHASKWIENEKSPSELHNRSLYHKFMRTAFD